MSDYRDEYKNSYALVIGIDTYTDPRFAPLGNAEEDAAAFAELIKRPPFNFDVSTLFGKDATRDGIETALFQLRATGPDDRVLVYFAGHGYTLVDEFKQETGYLAAADTVPEKDYTALELEGVTDLTRRAKAKHIAFLFDACYSGQALGLARSAAGVTSDKFLTRRAFQVISAGAGDQTVSDVYSMTGVLLEGLKAGIADEDGLVTLSEIGLYLQKTITADSGRTQIPQFGHLRGSQGGEFVFYQDTSIRLPNDLQIALVSAREGIRVGGVEELGQICLGADAELSKLATARLERILAEDASSKVKLAARRALFPGSEEEPTVHSTPGSRPVATGVESPAAPAPRPPATRQRKSGGKKPVVPTSMLLGGIVAAAVLGLGVIVCLLSSMFQPPPPLTETPADRPTEGGSGEGTLVPMTDEPTAPPDEQASIKSEITAVINKSYELKASTLRNLTTDGLADAYTGDELDYRIHTVELAINENCYWEVSLDKPDSLTFIFVGEDQARVSVLRTETRLHYCNGGLDGEWTHEHDRYINYIDLLFADGRWLINRIQVSDIDPD